MFKSSLAALALASSLAAGCGDRAPHVIAVPASTAEIDRPGQMTVNGQATLEVSPDCADLTITLSADDIKPGSAAKQLEAKKQTLISSLKKIGVETADIKLSNLQLDPIYEPNREGWATLKVRTYRAQITVTATTRDFSKIADIMDGAASAGASSISNQFRRSDLPALKKKVRDMALAAAKDKAKQTADALGIKLGRVISVAENQGGMMWRATYFPQVANSMETNDASGSVVLGGSLQPLTLDVTIGYELAKET
ncbi:MAG TPA: SIMPL domain-containing protein [Kofleriaceae bacterium]|nr:SIMPL domain-containing protein [Kofleriaceae bacterium]